MVSFAADTFDARKMLLVSTLVVGMVGAAIAPGSQSIGRLIAAQALVGVAFSSLPLGYSIPSEIVPRKYRPCTFGEIRSPFLHFASFGSKLISTLSSGTSYNEYGERSWRHLWPSYHRGTEQGQCTHWLAHVFCKARRPLLEL